MKQSDSNNKTLEVYESKSDLYISSTPNQVNSNTKKWIDNTVKRFPKEAKIIEIGSAGGRDADYIEGQGYSVERTDAVLKFVEYNRQNNHSAEMFNVLQDQFNKKYDIVFANGVFIHFNCDELKKVLSKIYKSLNKNGVISFPIKRGKGEKWLGHKLGIDRYYHFWTKKQITEILNKIGFGIRYSEFDGKNNKWIRIIADKKHI